MSAYEVERGFGEHAGVLGRVREHVIFGRWGWLPFLSLVLALGLLATAIAFQGAVAGAPWAPAVFWASILMMIVPVTARLVSLDASRGERLGLVLLLGSAFYLVKVMHSPYDFTFSDELVHAFNVDQILQTNHLFGGNAILPVTPTFPGLEILTSALAATGAISTYTAGLVIVGFSRLLITLALYLFYEKVSQSQRVAGLASVIYMANSNYLYWSAQFSYESLALPLATMVLFALLYRQEQANRKHLPAITLIVLVATLAITVTHHLTSIALISMLFLVAGLYSLSGFWSLKRYPTVWGIAFAALAALVFWLTFVASGTFDYILPVIRGAFLSSIRLVTGAESGRDLFTSNAGVSAPSWEQYVGIASVLLILFGIPLGMLQVWQRYRRSVFALVLAITALLYFPVQGMRLTGAGWETANRASEFLFVGIGFVLALGAVKYWIARPNVVNSLITSLVVTVLFTGAVVSGWAPALRLPKPYQVSIQGQAGSTAAIEPQGLVAARWAKTYLGTGNRLATDNSDALLMQRYGLQYPLAGTKYGVRDLFFADQIGRGELEILQVTQVKYLVFALDPYSWDRMLGLYYDPSWRLPQRLVSQAKQPNHRIYDAQPGVDRLLDTGNILVYDVGGLENVAAK